jgi:hypothetical protein
MSILYYTHKIQTNLSWNSQLNFEKALFIESEKINKVSTHRRKVFIIRPVTGVLNWLQLIIAQVNNDDSED